MFPVFFALLLSPIQPGYLLSKPIQHKNLSVYLILGEETALAEASLLCLEEAMDKDALTVFETGNVNMLSVENKGLRPIFIQAGDIVKGGKQDRVLAQDLLVPPHSGQISIASFCVERSRWSQRGEEETTAFNSSKKRVAGKEMRKAIRGQGKSQQRVWSNVAQEQQKLTANMSTDVRSEASATSYQLSLENATLQRLAAVYGQSFEGVVEAQPQAIGFAFCVNGSFSGADVYGSRALFVKLWPRLIEAAITEAIADYDVKASLQKDDLAWKADLRDAQEPRSGKERRVGEVGDLVHYQTLEDSGAMVHQSWETKDTQPHGQQPARQQLQNLNLEQHQQLRQPPRNRRHQDHR